MNIERLFSEFDARRFSQNMLFTALLQQLTLESVDHVHDELGARGLSERFDPWLDAGDGEILGAGLPVEIPAASRRASVRYRLLEGWGRSPLPVIENWLMLSLETGDVFAAQSRQVHRRVRFRLGKDHLRAEPGSVPGEIIVEVGGVPRRVDQLLAEALEGRVSARTRPVRERDLLVASGAAE